MSTRRAVFSLAPLPTLSTLSTLPGQPEPIDDDDEYARFLAEERANDNRHVPNDYNASDHSDDYEDGDEFQNLGFTDLRACAAPRTEVPVVGTITIGRPRPSAPAPGVHRTTWGTLDETKQIADALAQMQPVAEEDLVQIFEEDLFEDMGSEPLPVSTREIVAEVVHVPERPTVENPIARQRTTMSEVYHGDGAEKRGNIRMLSEYMVARVSIPPRAVVPAAATATPRPARKTRAAVAGNRFDALADAPVPVEPAATVNVFEPDRSVPVRPYVEEPTEDMEEPADVDEPEEAPEAEPTPSDEVRARAAARVAAIAARCEAARARAEAKRAARLSKKAAAQCSEPHRPRHVADRELTNAMFYETRIAPDMTRHVLNSIYKPSTLMTFYGMFARVPEEMVKCRDDKNYVVLLPPLASDDRVMIASPTRANPIHTPIYPVGLCSAGTECRAFLAEAYRAAGAPVPDHLHDGRECNALHYSPFKTIIKTVVDDVVREVQVVQCSVPGCHSPYHYTPGLEPMVVVHIAPNRQDCARDTRDMCFNALGDGCCRRHRYAGPVMIGMMMRGLLDHHENNPRNWPVGPYSYPHTADDERDREYMRRLWREVVGMNVPGSKNVSFIERFRIRNVWPPQEERTDAPHKPVRAKGPRKH